MVVIPVQNIETFPVMMLNLLILDVKNVNDTKENLSKNKFCEEIKPAQCEYGHCAVLENGNVQLAVCEFITAGSCSEDSAKNTKSGEFLTDRKVIKAEVIDNIEILEE